MITEIYAVREGEPETNATIRVNHAEGLDVLDAIDKCFSAWFKTPEGKDAWEYTCGDYNIGDYYCLARPPKEFQQRFGFFFEEDDVDNYIKISYDRVWGNGDSDDEEDDEDVSAAEGRDWSGAEMIEVLVFCDTTGLYTKEECDADNLCDILFPKEIVTAFYEENKATFDGKQMQELGITAEECSFENWLNRVSTAGDTEYLCDFAIERGFTPRREL